VFLIVVQKAAGSNPVIPTISNYLQRPIHWDLEALKKYRLISPL